MIRVINQQNNHFSPYHQNDAENEEVEVSFIIYNILFILHIYNM